MFTKRAFPPACKSVRVQSKLAFSHRFPLVPAFTQYNRSQNHISRDCGQVGTGVANVIEASRGWAWVGSAYRGLRRIERHRLVGTCLPPRWSQNSGNARSSSCVRPRPHAFGFERAFSNAHSRLLSNVFTPRFERVYSWFRTRSRLVSNTFNHRSKLV